MDILDFFQRLDRALQLPIAVLPVAALLLRFGQSDLLNITFIAQAGGTIFDNLALTFAIGVTSSWSKDSASAAAPAGAVGYFVLTGAMVIINPGINIGVLAGIIASLAGDAAYNRWSDIKLPDFLSFFGGRCFVPVAIGFFCLVLAAAFGYVWPPVQHAIYTGGEWIVSAGVLGSGIFGFIDRPLIPTDLYQVLNTIARFQIGELTNTVSTVFHGDINRFYAGNDAAGMFMSDFFSIIMFGLPGVTLTMYFAAPKGCHPMVGGMLLFVAIAAFLTDVTEPPEFLFMFLVPLLYLLHTLLTGISPFVTTLLDIHAGFSFSAGAVDYALIYNLPVASQSVQMLLAMGVVFFAIYFVMFSLVIRMFNPKMPGREDKEGEIVTEGANSNAEEGLTQLAANYITAVGGADNLKAIDACITRLHLTVADSARANDVMYKRLGASGVVKLNRQTIQVIVDAKTEFIGDAVEEAVARDPVATASARAAPATAVPVAKPQAVPNAVSIAELVLPIAGNVVALDQVPDEAFAGKAVGDGVAVKPTDKAIVSPATGTIVKIFNTNHAFCLETEKGTEIIVHMGIDTVTLEGKGFKRLVKEGAQVRAGQPILEMDLGHLDANAHSMISPMVCSDIDDFSGLIVRAQGHVVAS